MKKLGEILKQQGLLTEEQENSIENSKLLNEKFGEASIRLGYITEGQLLDALESQTGVKRVNLFQYSINESVLKLIPEKFALENTLLPLDTKEKKITVVVNDPLDYFVLEDIRSITGLEAEPVIATKKEILNLIKKYYGFAKMINELGLDEIEAEESKYVQSNLNHHDDTAIGRLIDQVLSSAVSMDASDIHLDPNEKNVVIRFRIDGVLRTEQVLPRRVHGQLVSKVKVLARMKIQETRRSQDGRIKKTVEGRNIDLRISTLPTIHGEKVVMRILELDKNSIDLTKIGATQDELSMIERMVDKPHGIVLVAGPTGSGKTTTLYSCLSKVNNESVNIVTVEDPVEMQINGVNQVQVQSEIDVTFATALRSILRQDPNIIMIGEIRDYETAKIATSAALTGHLVLSTIHTNDAVKTITRLIDMGVEPFLVSTSINGVISQRLVRKVCPSCRTSVEPTASEKQYLESQGFHNVDKVTKAKGCYSCNETGYKGRTAIFEILELNDELKSDIVANMDFVDFKNKAINNGMKTIVKSGIEKVLNGVTTLEEVLKVSLE